MSSQVTSIRFTPANTADRQTGLLGFVTCMLGDLVLDGITVRRRRDGLLTLSYPARRGRDGEQHPYIRPRDDRARRDLEHEILSAIDISGGDVL